VRKPFLMTQNPFALYSQERLSFFMKFRVASW